MSDYIYMLESHLNPDQNRVVEEVQEAAGQANVNLFLTGGAMRDMLAGFRIRDLDVAVEGNALKVVKTLCERAGAKVVSPDEVRKSAELVFPSGATAQIGMSRQEKYARTGAKPQVTAATIQEDLRGRDFTCNGDGAGEGGAIMPISFALPLDFTLLFDPELDILRDAAKPGRHANVQTLANLSHALPGGV